MLSIYPINLYNLSCRPESALLWGTDVQADDRRKSQLSSLKSLTNRVKSSQPTTSTQCLSPAPALGDGLCGTILLPVILRVPETSVATARQSQGRLAQDFRALPVTECFLPILAHWILRTRSRGRQDRDQAPSSTWGRRNQKVKLV